MVCLDDVRDARVAELKRALGKRPKQKDDEEREALQREHDALTFGRKVSLTHYFKSGGESDEGLRLKVLDVQADEAHVLVEPSVQTPELRRGDRIIRKRHVKTYPPILVKHDAKAELIAGGFLKVEGVYEEESLSDFRGTPTLRFSPYFRSAPLTDE